MHSTKPLRNYPSPKAHAHEECRSCPTFQSGIQLQRRTNRTLLQRSSGIPGCLSPASRTLPAVIFLSSAHPQVQQRCGARQAVCHRLDFRAVAVRHAAEASACMLLTCARAQSSSGVKSAARMQGAEPGLLGSGCLLPTDPRRIWTAQSSSGVESTSSGE